MKIQSVTANNHKHAFEIATKDGTFTFPYSKVDPSPSPSDPLIEAYVDDELGREGFTYVLKSGAEDSVHIDAVLEYNEDPTYMRDLLVYRLTVEAQKCLEASGLSKREVIRRLGTSASQFYRLLDQSNHRKSIDRLVVLLRVLNCEVDFTVRPIRTGKSHSSDQRERVAANV
jgi:predicted XRE-type DNA-binding protein